MPPPTASRLVRLFLLLLALALGAALPTPTLAQCPPSGCADGSGPEVDAAPSLSVSPGSTATSQSTVAVTIVVHDDLGLQDSTFHVYVNGVEATSSFTFTRTVRTGHPLPHRATATGIVPVGAAGTTLSARMCDTATPVAQCTASQTLAYTVSRPGVAVSPNGATVVVGAGAQTQAFGVQNTGTAGASFSLTAECRDARSWAAVSCSVPASTAVLAPGASATVLVSYSAAAGQETAISLAARQADAPGVRDAGWVDVTAAGSAGSGRTAPAVSLVNLQSGGSNNRGDCVTVATAPRGAFECGDLRIVHALPAHRTRGRTWQPSLLYNSQQAHPRPTVYADVTLPAGSAVPWYVEVVVSITGGVAYSASLDGGAFAPGTTRRIGVQWDGLSTPTGLYAYTLQVTPVYQDARGSSASASSEIAIVNRSTSQFGRGWWWAGWEEVMCVTCGTAGAPPRMLWIGGDGSTRVFEPLVTWASWIAQNTVGPPDTLYLVSEGGITFYRRGLRGGGEINFDGGGEHFRTVNRLGQVTWFDHYQGRLDGVYVPNTGNGVAPAWLLGRTSGRLTHVEAASQGASSRVVYLSNTDGRVLAIQDPDQNGVTFTYDAQNRISGQNDRRQVLTSYTYDGVGKLASARLWMSGVATDSIDVVTQFQAAESRGVVGVGTSGFSAARGDAYTRMDGPRTDVEDVTQMHLDERGLVRRVVNAAGQATVARRGNPAFPALVTETVGPAGRDTVVYDARGRVQSSTSVNPLGDGVDRTVTYTYDDRWDKPVSISAPGLGLTRMAYTYVGNLMWQEAAGVSRRVYFDYHNSGALSGQLARIRYPHPATGAISGGGADTLAYDAVGNLEWTRTAAGFYTRHHRDALGRDTLTLTPTDSVGGRSLAGLASTGVRQRTEYDVMDRARVVETIGPAMQHAASTDLSWAYTPTATPQERLRVETWFNGEGQPTEVQRQVWPDPANVGEVNTFYGYDNAGRKTSESGSQGAPRQLWYDQGGNLVRAKTLGQPIVTMQYDALGRLVRRTVPAVSHAVEYDRLGLLQHLPRIPLPRFPNAPGGAYLVPEEDSYYRFDAAGNQVYAENRDAIVRRSYYPNGALRGDTLQLRDYASTSFTQSYGLEYGYDAADRVTSTKHPLNLAAPGEDVDQYAYHTSTTGALAQLTSRLGQVFSFAYDYLGRPTVMGMPGGVQDSTGYDLDGRRTWHRVRGPSTSGYLLEESMRYDGRGKLVRVDNGSSAFQQWYSGSGNLAATDWQAVGTLNRQVEEYVTDPLGNVVQTRTGDGDTPMWAYGNQPRYNAYEGGQARVSAMAKVVPANPGTDFKQDSTAQWFDVPGNLLRTYTVSAAGPSEAQTRNFYGGDDRLRATQRVAVRQAGQTYSLSFSGVWEEYRYDPLGRRVLVRTRTDGGLCDTDPWTCTGSITRFVWAGDQILWELKAPGNEGGNLEAVSGTGAAYGRVSYTHAGGIDRPLVVTRDGTSVIPHQNWRGMFALGTTATGTRGVPDIAWPGFHTTPWHGETRVVENWFGGLTTGMRDASGQIYMRNRYYDPASGQFTQTDPIGLAGGMNAYGFADGDPVSYSDPYGLSGCDKETRQTAPWRCSFGYRTLRFFGVSEETADFIGQVGYGGAMIAGGPGSGEGVRGSAAGAAAAAVSRAGGTTLSSGIIYRAGRTNPGNLVPRAGEEAVSFRNSLSNPAGSGSRPVFRPGADYIAVDVSRLPPGSVVLDASPAGHVSVRGVTPDQIKAAVVDRGTLPRE